MKTTWYVKAGFVLALVLAASTVLVGMLPIEKQPEWLKWATARHLTKGLDLQGGVRLVYTVEVRQAIKDKRDRMAADMVEFLKTKGEIKDASTKKTGETSYTITFKEPKHVAKIDKDFLKRYKGSVRETGRDEHKGSVSFQLTDDEVSHSETTTYEQAIKTIQNRIDKLGLKETTVTQRGADISIEIPGQEETQSERIKRIISQTARLEFKMVDDESKFFLEQAKNLPADGSIKLMKEAVSSPKGEVVSYYLEATSTKDRSGQTMLQNFIAALELPDDRTVSYGSRPEMDEGGKPTNVKIWRTWLLKAEARVTGEYIDDARVAVDPDTNQPYVALSFNQRGAQLFDEVTTENVKRRMAIVLDNQVDSAPQIRERISGGNAQINLGGYKDYNTILKEAGDLVIVLKAGSLPAPVSMAHETVIGPALGRDAIRLGWISSVLGGFLVVAFMILYYRFAGVLADISLAINVTLILAIMSIFEATLTLPGIAGIVLTMGMAVDANVLIYERIREELRGGKSPRSAVEAGFGRAFWTIFDSQITTFFAGVVLLQYGSGPIKGFAVTLLIGIITSIFTGVFVTRIFFDLIVERKQPVKVLSI